MRERQERREQEERARREKREADRRKKEEEIKKKEEEKKRKEEERKKTGMETEQAKEEKVLSLIHTAIEALHFSPSLNSCARRSRPKSGFSGSSLRCPKEMQV